MQFTLQGFGPFLHWLTLGILFVMPVVIGLVIYKLGSLPGDIARARNHPQAVAISICGWMGIITLVLWPIAMVWAHLRLADRGSRRFRFSNSGAVPHRQAAAGIAAARGDRGKPAQDACGTRSLAMLWAIVSSAFVIYLYRSLNAHSGAEAAGVTVPADAIDAELTRLLSRIEAIENVTGDKARGTTP